MFTLPKPEEKCAKQGMHLLIYYLKKVLLERLISVWCELDKSVNHAIDECMEMLSVSLYAEGGHFHNL